MLVQFNPCLFVNAGLLTFVPKFRVRKEGEIKGKKGKGSNRKE
jgi:hypothetical protein